MDVSILSLVVLCWYCLRLEISGFGLESFGTGLDPELSDVGNCVGHEPSGLGIETSGLGLMPSVSVLSFLVLVTNLLVLVLSLLVLVLNLLVLVLSPLVLILSLLVLVLNLLVLVLSLIYLEPYSLGLDGLLADELMILDTFGCVLYACIGMNVAVNTVVYLC